MQKIKNVINKDAKIAVLCGGMSSEAEVSMRSGKGCYEALQRLGFKNSELVVVDKDIAETLKKVIMIMHTTLSMANMAKMAVFRVF